MQSQSLKPEGWNGELSTSCCLEYLERNGNILSGKPLVSAWEITSQGITAVLISQDKSHQINLMSFHGGKTDLMLRWALMGVMYHDFNKEEKSAAWKEGRECQHVGNHPRVMDGEQHRKRTTLPGWWRGRQAPFWMRHTSMVSNTGNYSAQRLWCFAWKAESWCRCLSSRRRWRSLEVQKWEQSLVCKTWSLSNIRTVITESKEMTKGDTMLVVIALKVAAEVRKYLIS